MHCGIHWHRISGHLQICWRVRTFASLHCWEHSEPDCSGKNQSTSHLRRKSTIANREKFRWLYSNRVTTQTSYFEILLLELCWSQTNFKHCWFKVGTLLVYQPEYLWILVFRWHEIRILTRAERQLVSNNQLMGSQRKNHTACLYSLLFSRPRHVDNGFYRDLNTSVLNINQVHRL